MASPDDRPPVTFVAFIISLASNAAVHFGDRPDPVTNARRAPNLDAARQAIALIAMLKDKTQGNLTAEERQLVDQVLAELQMRLDQARKGPGPFVQP